jgi:tRNA pseudouridine55 synthase
MPKEYVGEVTLGAVSQTDDAEGPIARTPNPPPPPTLEQVRAIVAGFVGEIQQVPPARSAIKVGGKRAYKLSRRGQAVELPPRPVMIHAITVESYEYPRLTIRVACGGGTYIRSLARDIGVKLGLGGYLSRLVRTRIGPFTATDSATLDQLDTAPLEQLLLPTEMVQ